MIIKDIPEELHRAIKVEAAKQGRSMKALVIELLEKYITECQKKEGKNDRK